MGVVGWVAAVASCGQLMLSSALCCAENYLKLRQLYSLHLSCAWFCVTHDPALPTSLSASIAMLKQHALCMDGHASKACRGPLILLCRVSQSLACATFANTAGS